MNGQQIITNIAAVIGVIGGPAGVWAWAKYRAEAKVLAATAAKTDIDAVAVIQNMALGMLAPAQEQITAMTQRLRDADQRITALTSQVEYLTKELAGARDETESLRGELAQLTGRKRPAGRNDHTPEVTECP